MEKFKLALIEELASKGNKNAIIEMAQYYYDYKNAKDLDTEKSELINSCLLKLAESNDKEAMILLGGLYYEGVGFQQSYKEAVKWYEKAAAELDERGLCYLGYCYYHGRDIEKNYEKAYSYFSLSAYMGNVNAMYKLGDMFFYGQYVKEDKDAAFFWYHEGLGNDEGLYVNSGIEYRLGKCYLHGYGVEENLILALEMLQSAEKGFLELAEGGDPFSGITLKSVKKEIDIARERLYAWHETPPQYRI